MEFNEYQKLAQNTAVINQKLKEMLSGFDIDRLEKYVEIENLFKLLYMTIGMGGETGETLEKVKKLIRDSKGIIDDEIRGAIKKELGDQLWYIANFAHVLNITLDDVATTNLAKISSRKAAGTLHGSGDNR